MRNLKRALSLALASVMLLGMMVVGTSAASYTDVDEKDNVEAIEVLNEIKVMIGRQGNFEPDEPVKRHEMATIMAKLVLGVDTADSYVGSHPFTDVVPWADKYVAACYENGLVAGTSATTFGGSKDLTAVQAAAMMLRALGYKDLSKGADDWRAPVTSKANLLRLFQGVASNPNEKLNRNQVAQLALNTLKSPMVNTIDGTFDVTSGQGGVVISGGSRTYETIVSNDAYATAISDVEGGSNAATSLTGYAVELGEHLYNGKLRLNNSDLDVFGRPARTWEYDGKEIGTYVKDELLRKQWTDEVTGKDFYDLLSRNTIDGYTFLISVDGVERNDANAKTMLAKASTNMANAWFDENDMFRANDNAVGGTGKGVLTQLYVDSSKKMVYISVVNTYLAKAAENYDEKDEDVTLNVYKLDNQSGNASRPVYVKTNITTPEPIKASNEDFAVKDVKKDDFFLVTVADGGIQSMAKPEVIDETVISSFSLGSWVNNGSKYEYATTAKYDDEVLDNYDVKNMKDLTYNIFLDKYGYLIGLERNEDPDEYVFLTGLEAGASNLAAKNVDGNVIHMDGRMATVSINLADSTIPSATKTPRTKNLSQLNTWCKYTVDTKGVYTLTEVKESTTQNETKVAVNPVKVAQYAQDVATYYDAGAATKTISQRYWSLNAASTNSYVYGNENSVYINVSLKGIAVDDQTLGGPNCQIINEVDAVVTDVANANIVVKNVASGTFQAPGAEIYTLYNDKNIVIAAITIGEDDGSNVRYVTPVKANVEEEDFGHGSGTRAVDGKWTWHRKVVTLDGTVETITETGDTLKYIGAYDAVNNRGMQMGVWYEIRLNADNDVRARTQVDFATADDKFADSLEDANDQAPKYDTVILYDDGTTNSPNVSYAMTGLKLEKNGMLYAERDGQPVQDSRRGIYIDDATKVVLITAEDANGDMKNQYTYTGRVGLEQALSKMNAESGSFTAGSVELSAVIKMGKTTVVVINDKNPVPTATNPDTKPTQGVKGVKVAVKGADTGTSLAVGYFGVALPDIKAVDQAVRNFLIDERGFVSVGNMMATANPNVYQWSAYNGVAYTTYQLDTGADVNAGVRIRYTGETGLATSDGYEIISGNNAIDGSHDGAAWSVKTNAVWIKNYKGTTTAEGRYIAVRASSNSAWTWSDAVSTDGDIPAAATEAGVVTISGHDYDVFLSTYTLKYKINDEDWSHAAAGNLINTSGAKYTKAEFQAKYPGTVLGTDNDGTDNNGVWDGSYAALGDTVALADKAWYKTGFITIKHEAVSGYDVTVKDYTDTVSSDIVVPVNTAVSVTITDTGSAGAETFRANDAAKTEFAITAAGGKATQTITTGTENVTFGKLETITLSALTKTTNVTNSLDGVSLVWKYNGRTITAGDNIKAAAGEKVTAELVFDGTGVTFGGTSARTIVASATGGSLGTVTPKGIDASEGSWSTATATIVEGAAFKSRTVSLEITVNAGNTALAITVTNNNP